MSTVEANTVRTLRLFDTGGWVLPWKVAHEEGYFAEQGFAVEFVRGEVTEERQTASTIDLETSDKESAFVQQDIDVYSACEWGVIKRVTDLGAGKIIGNRRTVGMTHGFYVLPDRGLQLVSDLAGVPVAVNFNSGSHYAAIEALEEFLASDDVKVVHFGAPYKRYEALITGKVEVAVLMEPYSTLAEVQGAVKIADYPGRGGWIGSDQLTEEELGRFYTAVRQGVEALNASPEKYRDVLVDQLKQYSIEPALVEKVRERIQVPRYLDPVPYDRSAFTSTYDWMVGHDLIRPGVAFEDVVHTNPLGEGVQAS